MVQFDDESMTTQMELTEGALVSLKITKIQVSWHLTKSVFRYQTSFGRCDSHEYAVPHPSKDRSVLQPCVPYPDAQQNCENVLTGATRYGPNYTLTSTETAFTGQHWGQVEDSYEVEEMNRVVGKKAAIRAIKEMNMGTENQTYAQYYQRPTQFYDLGDSMMDVGLGGINSRNLTRRTRTRRSSLST